MKRIVGVVQQHSSYYAMNQLIISENFMQNI